MGSFIFSGEGHKLELVYANLFMGLWQKKKILLLLGNQTIIWWKNFDDNSRIPPMGIWNLNLFIILKILSWSSLMTRNYNKPTHCNGLLRAESRHHQSWINNFPKKQLFRLRCNYMNWRLFRNKREKWLKNFWKGTHEKEIVLKAYKERERER